MPYILDKDRNLWILAVNHQNAVGVVAALVATALGAYIVATLDIPFALLLFRVVSCFVITYVLALLLLVMLQRAVMVRLKQAYDEHVEPGRHEQHEEFEQAISEALHHESSEESAADAATPQPNASAAQ